MSTFVSLMRGCSGAHHPVSEYNAPLLHTTRHERRTSVHLKKELLNPTVPRHRRGHCPEVNPAPFKFPAELFRRFRFCTCWELRSSCRNPGRSTVFIDVVSIIRVSSRIQLCRRSWSTSHQQCHPLQKTQVRPASKAAPRYPVKRHEFVPNPTSLQHVLYPVSLSSLDPVE